MVFGAPEIEAATKPEKARFLTVQPNLEVVAYLESADAPQICKLSRFAACAPRTSGPVQTFALRRESLYLALESGLTLDEACGFVEVVFDVAGNFCLYEPNLQRHGSKTIFP